MQIPTGKPRVIACMRDADKKRCGDVRFYEVDGEVMIVAELFGLPKDGDFHGFHIHSGYRCMGAGFSETGGHFNPADARHPWHAGDLPPLLNRDGRAFLVCITNRFRLRDVIGRTIVVHSGPDDFRSQPAGDSGSKIACGVICAN